MKSTFVRAAAKIAFPTALLLAAGVANAEVVYGQRGISLSEKASFAVVGYSGTLQQGFVNSNGHVLVQNGSGFQSIGSTQNGLDTIEAKWNEVILPTGNFVDVVFRTRLGSDLVPLGSTTGGAPTAFWGWKIGSTDSIEMMPWVTEYNLVRATWSYSTNGGTSFIPGANHTSRQQNPWQGVDPGDLVGSQLVGAGVNAFSVRFQIELIPAPGSLALLGMAGLITTRRRRA